jgi:hypothetical protein
MTDTNTSMETIFQEIFGLSVAEAKRRLALVEAGGLNDAYMRGFQDGREALLRLSEHALKEGIR